MILFPAIDIKNGSCVRLVQGKMEEATVFNEDPVDQAKIFESKGCKWIHVIDLDGAIKGHSVNQKIIKEIKLLEMLFWRNEKTMDSFVKEINN